MNHLYPKLAATSVCIALSFTLEANTEAKAVTFTFAPTTTFEVIDLDDQYYFGGAGRFDGLGDVLFSSNFGIVYSQPKYIEGGHETASFAEFNIGNFSAVPNTFINSAIFQTDISSFEVNESLNPGSLGIFGYVGNGTAEASDFEAGVFLSSVDVSSLSSGDTLNFNVTPFVNQRVSNGDAFAGFGIRPLNAGGLAIGNSSRGLLIVETAEPVPEPTTIFGSAIGLCLGGWLKRSKSSQQNKTLV